MVKLDRAKGLVRPPSSKGQALLTRPWTWPLIAAVALGGIGFAPRSTVAGVMRAQMADELRTLLDVDVEAVRILFRAHQAMAMIAGHDPEIRSLASELAAARDVDPAALIRSPKFDQLQAALGP